MSKRNPDKNALANPGIVPAKKYKARKVTTLKDFDKAIAKLPNEYREDWIERLPEGVTRTAVLRLYKRCRDELKASGRNDSVRDLLIRRLVWYDHMLSRIEIAMARGFDFYGSAVPAKVVPLMRWYVELGKELFTLARTVGIDMRPVKSRQGVAPPAWREPIEVEEIDEDD